MPNQRVAAVIGCGKYVEGSREGWAAGHDNAIGWLAADPNIRLLGVDISEENLATFGRKFDLPDGQLFSSTAELYAQAVPNFVSICTWPRLHALQTIQAANAGVKGILCEKPVASSPAEMWTMTLACEARGVKLAVGHQRRLQSPYMMIKRLLDSGAIGDSLVFEGRQGLDWDMMTWTTHWFDMANYYFNSAPLWVLAGVHDDVVERRYGLAAESTSVVFAEYPANRQAIFVTGPPSYSTITLMVHGSGGMIHLRDDIEVYSERGREDYPIEQRALQGHGAICRELIDAVETGAPMTCDISKCAAATAMAFAAQESARTMRKVALPIDFDYAPLEMARS